MALWASFPAEIKLMVLSHYVDDYIDETIYTCSRTYITTGTPTICKLAAHYEMQHKKAENRLDTLYSALPILHFYIFTKANASLVAKEMELKMLPQRLKSSALRDSPLIDILNTIRISGDESLVAMCLVRRTEQKVYGSKAISRH